MDEHHVERAVVVPITDPASFPASPETGTDWLRAKIDIQARIANRSAERLLQGVPPPEDDHAK